MQRHVSKEEKGMRREKKAIMKGLTAMGLAICISAMLCVTGQAMEPSARRNEDAVTAADSAGAGIMPMSANVRQLAELSISSGTATVGARASGMPGEVTKISISIYLQKKNANGSYSTVKYWNGSRKGTYYSFRRTCRVSRGAYRVKARITSYKGSKSETVIKFSSVKRY